ncbi:TPA: hypothetical protein ACPYU1_003031 [Raoultella planticola]
MKKIDIDLSRFRGLMPAHQHQCASLSRIAEYALSRPGLASRS